MTICAHDRDPGVALGAGAFFGAVPRQRRVGRACLSTVVHRAARALPRHAHGDAFVCLLTAGAYESRTRTRTFDLAPRSAVYHPADFDHVDRIGDDGGAFFCLQFDVDAALDGAEGRVDRRAEVFELADPGAQLLLAKLLGGLVLGGDDLALEADVAEFAGSALLAPERAGRSPPAWVARVAERLAQEPAGAARLDDLAGDAGVHPTTLTRLFRAHVGCSLGEYRQRAQAERAFHRVTESRESLSRISVAAGYADQSHMTRAFRRRFGVTPGRLRRAVRAARPA